MTLGDEEIYIKEWQHFVKMKSSSYLLAHYSPILFRGIGFLSRKIPLEKIFINSKNKLQKLNLIRCESHYELLRSILENMDDIER